MSSCVFFNTRSGRACAPGLELATTVGLTVCLKRQRQKMILGQQGDYQRGVRETLTLGLFPNDRRVRSVCIARVPSRRSIIFIGARHQMGRRNDWRIIATT
jgi:hypothetical protein